MKNPDLRNSDMSVPDTCEKPKFEKFKCVCGKQFFADGDEGP